jgi:hypothetical protein
MRLSRRPKPFDSDGKLLFEQIVKMDLGGMVCMRKSFTVPRNGEAVTVLDQGEESALRQVEG